MRRPYATDGGPLSTQEQAQLVQHGSHSQLGHERPMGEIVSELWENTETLVRNEIALAMTEIEQRTQKAKTDLTRVTASGVALYTGFLAIVVAAVLLLDKAIDLWASALLVGLVLCAAGYFLLPRGRSHSRETGGTHTSQSSYALKEMKS
jgi:hypothetical protein